MTMNSSVRASSATRWLRRIGLPLLILTALVATPTFAVAVPPLGHQPSSIVLPNASSAEGIARGHGSTFYAGDLFRGDIFRGNIRHGTAELFIDAPSGRMAVGMAFNRRHDLLFVAGGSTGQAYVYNTRSGAPVASYALGDPASSFINDVTVTAEGAWFTNSFQAVLYFVPIDKRGTPGDFQTLQLSGPAADTSGDFNLNGIRAADQGRTLIVGHSGNAALYTVDPDTGASATIAGISVGVDGIELSGKTLWVVEPFSNQISRIRLNSDLTTGTVETVITSELLQTPSTAAWFGNILAVVNAKFDTGFPPTADQYEVVLVGA
jgi:hypothetical protein